MNEAIMSFTVGTNDFRRALKAVAPHASRDVDLAAICRVRCYVDRENVTVSATDRFTAAMGLVSVWDNDLTTEGAVDLGLPDIGKILAVFTAGKDKADAPEWQLRIELLQKRTISDGDKPDVSSLTVRVTDVSGMIDGEVLDLPALTPHESFPDLPQLFANHLGRPAGLLDTFGVSGELLARMKTAAHVYGDEPLILSTPGEARAPIIARCGDSFLGLIMPVRMDEDAAVQAKERQEAWIRRLPNPTRNKLVDLDEVHHTADDPKSDYQLIKAAAELVIACQFGSASMIQRRLGVGFGKAAWVLDSLEEHGIVGPAHGSLARDVLYKPDQLAEVLALLLDESEYDEEPADPPPARFDLRTATGLIGFPPEQVHESVDEALAATDREYLEQAARLVIEEQFGSISMIARKLKVGKVRATRLMDQLEIHGVVAGPDGAKPREVLTPPDQLDAALEEIRNGDDS